MLSLSTFLPYLMSAATQHPGIALCKRFLSNQCVLDNLQLVMFPIGTPLSQILYKSALFHGLQVPVDMGMTHKQENLSSLDICSLLQQMPSRINRRVA